MAVQPLVGGARAVPRTEATPPRHEPFELSREERAQLAEVGLTPQQVDDLAKQAREGTLDHEALRRNIEIALEYDRTGPFALPGLKESSPFLGMTASVAALQGFGAAKGTRLVTGLNAGLSATGMVGGIVAGAWAGGTVYGAVKDATDSTALATAAGVGTIGTIGLAAIGGARLLGAPSSKITSLTPRVGAGSFLRGAGVPLVGIAAAATTFASINAGATALSNATGVDKDAGLVVGGVAVGGTAAFATRALLGGAQGSLSRGVTYGLAPAAITAAAAAAVGGGNLIDNLDGRAQTAVGLGVTAAGAGGLYAAMSKMPKGSASRFGVAIAAGTALFAGVYGMLSGKNDKHEQQAAAAPK